MTQQTEVSPISLRYAIEDAPELICKVAEAIGIPRIGYVPPGLYTTRPERFWDQDKAENRKKEIDAICAQADIIITDMEKEPRRRVLHPDDYSRKEVREAIDDNYLPMWGWFRERYRNAKLSEWGFSIARNDQEFPLVDTLTIENLDFFDVSCYAKPNKPNRQEIVSDRLKYAQTMAKMHNKLLMTWVWDRFKIEHNDDNTEYHPIPDKSRDFMLNKAIGVGGDNADVTVFWSHCYKVLAANRKERYLTESINRGADEAIKLINTQTIRLLSEMVLKVAESE